jgi:hypothetical protein
MLSFNLSSDEKKATISPDDRIKDPEMVPETCKRARMGA